MATIKNPVTVTDGRSGGGPKITNGVVRKCLAAEGEIDAGIFVEYSDANEKYLVVTPTTSGEVYGVTRTRCTAESPGEVWVYNDNS